MYFMNRKIEYMSKNNLFIYINIKIFKIIFIWIILGVILYLR